MPPTIQSLINFWHLAADRAHAASYTVLLEQLLNGLVVGSMYALIALGFCLVFGVLNKLNFAHSELFMLAGFVTIALVGLGAPLVVAGILTCVMIGLFGLVIELISFRKFKGKDAHVTAALSSLALGLVVIDAAQKIWGTEPLSVPWSTSLRTASFMLGDIAVSWLKLGTLAFTLVLMAALHQLITHTQFGRNIRATADSPEAAQLLGIDVKRVNQYTFVLASALAAVAGIMLLLRTGYATTEVGFSLGLKALAILAIGGMGELKGAAAGGLMVGLLESVAFHFGLGRLADISVWILMIGVLLVRPAGLFGSGGLHKEARA
jgi:branched-chain amino acid transport system permease protein